MKLTICNAELSKFSIVLPESPEAAHETAAAFLQRVVKTACGVDLSVADVAEHAIVLGACPPGERVCYDGYRIATDEKNLYLDGNLARGTLYAAYAFAERWLGWRALAPDTEVIETEGEAEIPAGIEIIDNPVFEYRHCDAYGFAKNREFSAFSRENAYGKPGDAYGGNVSSAGCHTFESLCPPSKYFDEHPEYYSLYEGKRIPGTNAQGAGAGQLCLTNPDVLRIVTENVLEKLRANPNLRIVDVSQNDNQRYCQCEACAKVDAEEGGPSGTMIRFVNAVAEAVEKEFPDVLVQTFAYQYTRKAPKLTKARKNVLVRYCTIEACFRHAIDDPSCEKNAGVFYEELKEWQQMADHLSIWDYITNYRCYVAPFPNFLSLRANARFFADCHALYLFEEDSPGSICNDCGELRSYVVGKLMWDPYMSEETYHGHIVDFLKGYYGAGWREVGKYLTLLHETTADYHMNCFEWADIANAFDAPFPNIGEYMAGEYLPKAYQAHHPKTYLNGFIERIDEAKALLDAAYEQAETELQKNHVARTRLSVTYIDLFNRPHDKKTMSDEEKAAYEAEVERYLADKDAFGLRYNIWTARYNAR